MILKRIPDKLKTDIEQFRSSHTSSKVLFFSAYSGMGKTYAALSYCADNKDSLYFSFRHISAELALKTFAERYPDVFKDCTTWTVFFDCLKNYGKEKRPTVFFDDVGERNDKTDFYAALKNFIEENSCDVLVVLIGRPWEQIDIPCQTISITPYSTQEIAETPSVSDKDSVDIFCLSAGITELLSLYDTSVSFEENVKALLHINSPFYRLMNNKMHECFRTPESYNTLLYALVKLIIQSIYLYNFSKYFFKVVSNFRNRISDNCKAILISRYIFIGDFS